MRRMIAVMLLLSIGGCQTTKSDLHMSMVLQNNAGPFVSQDFAERLALLVTEERYHQIFVAREPGTVVDKGSMWWVTFENGAEVKNDGSTVSQMRVLAKRLTIVIRKTNGEIVAIM